MSTYYMLRGHEAVPCSLVEWAAEFKEPETRQVAETAWGLEADGSFSVRISTVFLGLNHNFGPGEPAIYETMIFAHSLPEIDEYCERYATWQDAEDGHARIVALAIAASAQSPIGSQT